MNIAEFITQNARLYPNKKAITFPKNNLIYEYYDFQTYAKRTNQYAHFLKNAGVTRGQQVLVFVKPCLDFSILVFALFRLGAVPILIDPGMGITNLLKAVKNSKPDVLIGLPVVFLLKLFKPNFFKNIKLSFMFGGFSWRKIIALGPQIISQSSSEEIMEVMQEKDRSAILFTSGGTGEPKGVEYTHGILKAQTLKLKEMFALTPLDIDLPGFPLFSLFTLAIGMTSCIPAMNPSRPARANPKKIVKNILDQKVTFTAGSPAIWERVAEYCLKKNIQLSTVRNLVMFGAPVSPELLLKLKLLLPNGDSYTPYGATECLPITNISGNTLIEKQIQKYPQGAGTCVGKPAPGVKIKIIADENKNYLSLSDCRELPSGEVGEIIVHSNTVTPAYFNAQVATLEAKISGPEGLWHRMGDVGYLDLDGNLWFCGRRVHVVQTKTEKLFSVSVENIFNQIPEVKRTALVGLKIHGEVEPVLVVELKSRFKQEQALKKLKTIAANLPYQNKISKFYFSSNFPVDVRHNIKIDRIKLRDHFQARVP